MSLQEQIQTDLKTSLLGGNKQSAQTLRLMLAQIKTASLSGTGELDDSEAQKIIKTLVKKTKESRELFQKGNRPELVTQADEELAVMTNYLPQQLSENEVRQKLTEVLKTAPPNLEGGGLIGYCIKQFGGNADNGLVIKLIKELTS
ncbi:GatB/YqeY domain-containing protein [Patescibacteria group bacterium]|nr:GatB/YqeY domain-containing protein [Patescibacteria group bacterium]